MQHGPFAAKASDAGFRAWLYRPYIDLGAGGSPGHVHIPGVMFALKELVERKPYPRLHGLINPSFRKTLLRETRLPAYDLNDPLELPEGLRTRGWWALCASLQHFEDIEPEDRVRALWLLHRLCLHSAILDYAPIPSDDELRTSEAHAGIGYLRGLAHFAFANDGAAELDTTELGRTAALAPRGGWARIEATYSLAAAAAKLRHDPEGLRHWMAEHRDAIERAESDEHTRHKLMSRFHRMYAFVPQFKRDWAAMSAEMDLAQAYAEKMRSDTPETRAELIVLNSAIRESRTKEALILRDFDRAEMWARACVQHCPTDPRGWLELGQVLIEREKLQEAAAAYRKAARFGPPGTEIAWFMAGQCHESLNDTEAAADAYLAALELDPLAISAAERLAELAPVLGSPEIAEWINAREQALDTIENREVRGQAADVKPYQQYEGVLGRG